MGKLVHKLVNETELFQQLSEGDERAFEIIYHHYNKRLSPFVRKMVRSSELTEEIIQDIFVHLWINRKLLNEIKHPASYLFNTATNKTLDHLKKIANNVKMLDRLAHRSTEISDETQDLILYKESAEILELAISQLPERRRLIYQLSRNEGLTHEQIAERLNLSQSTVKNQLVHALKYIRNFMEQRASVFSYVAFFFLTRK